MKIQYKYSRHGKARQTDKIKKKIDPETKIDNKNVEFNEKWENIFRDNEKEGKQKK